MSAVIAPECYVDTMIVEILLYSIMQSYPQHSQPSIHHSFGTETATFMKSTTHDFVLAVIDDDKHKPTYFQQFEILREAEEARAVLKKHPNAEHYLIVLQPAIEKWLYYAASQASVQPEQFGLPPNVSKKSHLKAFTQRTKIKVVSGDAELGQFINHLCQASQTKSAAVSAVRLWMTEFIQAAQKKIQQL